MRITIYGILCMICSFIFMSLFNISFNFIIVILLSLFSQFFVCKKCSKFFSLAGYLTILPLLVTILLPCADIKKFLILFSFICAIGRIGCYFAGCCTGKVSTNKWYNIKYEGDYCINKRLNKKIVYVTPTILLEILLQFIFAILIYKFDNLYYFYGILNAILVLLTNYFRQNGREHNNIIFLILSLISSSIISYYKCNNSNIDNNFSFNPNIYKLIVSILICLITANDITLDYILNLIIK